MYGNNFGYPFIGGMPNQIVPPMTGNMMGPMIGAPLRSGGGGLRYSSFSIIGGTHFDGWYWSSTEDGAGKDTPMHMPFQSAHGH